MELLGFDSAVLPEVTLAGTSVFTVPRKNIDRVTDECVIYLVTSGELFFAEGDREYRLAEGDFSPSSRGSATGGPKARSTLWYICISGIRG